MGNQPRLHPADRLPDRPRITVAVDAPDRAFAQGVQTALTRLGYNLISRRTAGRQDGEQGPLAPRLLIMDDRRIPKKGSVLGHLPVILLSGAREDLSLRAEGLNDLVVGVVRRRARLAPIYELLQTTFDEREPAQASPDVNPGIPMFNEPRHEGAGMGTQQRKREQPLEPARIQFLEHRYLLGAVRRHRDARYVESMCRNSAVHPSSVRQLHISRHST